jgi:hypothetical protein
MRTIPGNIRKPQRNEGSFHSKKLKELCTSAVSVAIQPLSAQKMSQGIMRGQPLAEGMWFCGLDARRDRAF